MCNGRNHPKGCECGFGPPYDRDVPDYFDEHVGSQGGKDLSNAGPHCEKLAEIVPDNQLATQLVSTFVWQSFIGRPSTQIVERTTRRNRQQKKPVVYIVRHGSGYPRHDLLIFDPQLPVDKVEQGYVDVSPTELRSGWTNFRSLHNLTDRAMPLWLAKLNWQDIPEIAVEGMAAQRHFYIAMHPPRIVWTASSSLGLPALPSAALAISARAAGKALATVGIITSDKKGRTGVTTALHALKDGRTPIFVQGAPGSVRARDQITDSCFIEIANIQSLQQANACSPLSGVTPGRGEPVSFEGMTSGKVTTHVDGWTPELPWIVPGVQSRIITPAVTDGGDSGAALVNQQGRVIGFAHYRTGFNAKSPHSAWIWAESVFVALQLQ